MSLPSERRNRRQRRIAVSLLAVSVAIAGTMGLLFFGSGGPELDPRTLCPLDDEITASVVVVIDVTDPYSPLQTAWIRKRFDALRDSVPKYGRLAIYSVTPDTVVAPILARCNPGSGEDASRLTANPRMIEARWRSGFVEPLDSLLAIVLGKGSGTRSPIMETIQRVAVAEFLTTPREVPRRLYLISDMLQHTNSVSHYGPAPPRFDAFRTQPIHTRLRPDLDHVSVSIFYAFRPEAAAVQGRSHIQFWDDYFRDAGASVQSAERMPG